MPSNGNEYLIDAARAIVDRVPNARIYIVGEGELQDDLESRARANGLGDSLVFAGFRRDVAAALSAFDIAVFPSLWEGTPLTVLEALAMGKPIVSTDADGLRDVLTDGVDAVMVPRRDAAALADAVVRLAGDSERRTALSANARRTGALYDIGLFVRKMERLYALLHETSRPTRRAGVLRADLAFLNGASPKRGPDGGD
jgi:glycosyltransferase involved in cell wall biosynthesis